MDIEKKRHSYAHILAQAITDLYPGVKLAIGPVIENGFYYDFEFPEDVKFSVDDLPKVIEKMKEIIKQEQDFVREFLDIKDAKEFFKQEKFKLELINDLEEQGEKQVSIYKNIKDGEEKFVDLCKGPHISNTKELDLDAFTLHKVAGAYWRGDEKREMLTRIYGLAFDSKKELDEYLQKLEQAKQRDHRKLGKELEIFTFSDLVGKGLPLWTHYGAVIRRELENFIIQEELKRGYLHVVTPELAKVDLYRKSGHYPYYKDSMYPIMKIDDEELILRPMTCPHHFMLYKHKKHSYKELPMKIAELARLYRYEKSGELTGLLRVRSFCLADSHIICTKEQVKDVVKEVLDLIEYVAKVFGLQKGEDYHYRLSLGDRDNTEKYYKDDQAWDYAENVLREVLQELNSPFVEAKDEAAFYGPKIDIQMKNVLGKEDTAFTVQYDFCMPERFDLTYVDKDGSEKKAVVIHRSSIGAIERTVGFLIERYAGAFPVWLSPVQVKLLSVADRHIQRVEQIKNLLIQENIRVEIDTSSETIGNKIRKAVNYKIPYIIVIGDKEVESDNLQIKVLKKKEYLNLSLKEFINYVKQKVQEKSLDY